ncbi:MAG: class I SAM-dependent methyltransferase [Lachnospiraceae bacterium]|jgi:ubiquinone/menaquinone biosynthesis C-methylase UbiE
MGRKLEKWFWNFSALFTNASIKRTDYLNREIDRYTEAYLDKSMNVLETACSAGMASRSIAKHSGFVEACDLSEKMIAKAKKRYCPPNLHFSVQDVEALPYGENCFDAVVYINGLHVVEKPERALYEIRRVLKPGGILIIPDLVYEGGKVARLKADLLRKTFVHTYHRWKTREYMQLISDAGFAIKEQKNLKRRHDVTCCFIAARNKKF